MSSSREEDRPPPEAWNVLYNVTASPDEGAFRIVLSERDIPELTSDEATDAAEDFSQRFNYFCLVSGVAEVDVFGYTRYGDDIARFAGWHDDEPMDRTVETPLIDPLVYSPELVLYVQRTFLAAWPLWRVRVCSFFPREPARTHRPFDLMIYPDMVWVGQQPCPPAQLTEVMGKWCKIHHDQLDKTQGPRRRQFLYAREKAKEVFKAVHRSQVIFVAAFDNHESACEFHPVWILHPWKPSDYVSSQRDTMVGQAFAIDRHGTTHRNHRHRGDLCLHEWILPQSRPQSLTVRRASDAREWTIAIPDESILSDETLRRMGYL